MNAPTTTQELQMLDTLESLPSQPLALAEPDHGVIVKNSPMDMMLAAMGKGASLEQVEKMMDLQERWERREAEKAYSAAFAAFKAEAVQILKTTVVADGPLRGNAYAQLHTVVDAVTPALSRHGLSSSWKLTRDEKDWIEVTCSLKHVGGHFEVVSMGGPPDNGPGRNAIQSRASTVSYLERYTLKAICGVAEGGDDNDAAGTEEKAAADQVSLWKTKAEACTTVADLQAIVKEGAKHFIQAKDTKGYAAFSKTVQTHGAILRQQEAASKATSTDAAGNA